MLSQGRFPFCTVSSPKTPSRGTCRSLSRSPFMCSPCSGVPIVTLGGPCTARRPVDSKTRRLPARNRRDSADPEARDPASSEATAADVTGLSPRVVRVHSRVRQGTTSSAHVRIRGFVRGGRRIPLGDDIPLGRQSEILAALLEEAIGIPVEMVTRSRLRLRS